MCAVLPEEVVLFGGFHTLGYQLQVHAAAHGDDCDDQAGIVLAFVEIDNKTAINFQFVQRETTEIA